MNSPYILNGIKFLDVADYDLAQRLLTEQASMHWIEILNALTADAFPAMPSILGERMQYYWILWQSEWATCLERNARTDDQAQAMPLCSLSD